MDEDLKLTRRRVNEALEELDFLFIDTDRDPTGLVIDTSAKLGTGGAGDVYEAELFVPVAQQTIRVAVKTLRSGGLEDLRVAYRLLREISVWADLRHQNILSLIGFHLSLTHDVALLVCPLEPFGSVERYLKTHNVDIPGRMELVVQVARGVAYLHSLDPPVTHGDIKAANTLVNQQREAVLCDFGLAKSKFRCGLETSDNFAGSLPFCSPELFDGMDRSPGSDMWAMGCLVIEIVLSIKPFAQTTTLAALITTIVLHRKLPLSEEALKSPHDLWNGVFHCWHFEQTDRIHASEFLKYWELKIRSQPALGIEEPNCSSKACKHRRQQLGGLGAPRLTGAPIATIGASDVPQSRNQIIEPHDESQRRALRALEALPYAKLAKWSAIPARISCLMGTRTAVLKEIHTWLADTSPSAPPFFDLEGVAGIGKTTIAHTLAEEASRDGYLAASFFFSRAGDAELSNPTLVFSTLAYQLSSFNPSFLQHFGRAASSGTAFEDLDTQLQKLIVEPLQCVTPPSRPLLIVLDAFDECQKEGAKELLRLLLSGVLKVPVSLKIFMTSRPEPHLRGIFNHAENLHKLILHDIEASIVKNDIRLYLQTSFAEIPGRLGLQIGRRWARYDEIEALVERAETLFIVAATFARFVGDYAVRNPRQQLNLLLQRSESSFTGPNHTIDELYLQILRKIRSTTGNPHIIERLQLMVGAIILLQDPLPMAVMERLLGLSVGDGSRALHHLHSVISIPRSPNEFSRIHHASFPDFIIDPLRCTETEFCIHTDYHEARLATRCVELMTFAVEFGVIREVEGKEYWGEPLKRLERLERLARQARLVQQLPPELRESHRQRQALQEVRELLKRRETLELPEPQAREEREERFEQLHMLEVLQERLERLEQEERLERLQELDYALSWWWHHWAQAGFDAGNVMCLVEASISRCLIWWFESIRPRAPTCLTKASSWATLCQARHWVSLIAALAINAGHPQKAVELIEHARGTSATQSELDKLQASNPELSSEFLNLSFQLRQVVDASLESDTINSDDVLLPDATGSHRDLSKRWNDVLIRIRKLPGFETFLKPLPFNTLQPAATKGPIIIINIAQLRSDAIIILKAGDPVVIPLPRATPPTIQYLRTTFEKVAMARRRPQVAKVSDDTFADALYGVWDKIIEPIFNALTQKIRLPVRTRIWWNPTAAVWFFPLHAAGAWTENGKYPPFLSSYTPSLSTLLKPDAPAKLNVAPKMLLVSQTEPSRQHCLGGMRREVNEIAEHAPNTTVLEGDACTRDAVLTGLKGTAWIHFACHGEKDIKDPLKSSIPLQLRDAEALTLLDILRNDFPNAEMAFLCVDHSADGEEANHLAAGMLHSGFRSVIGSMWEIADEDRLFVASEFYKYMFRNGPEAVDYRDAARALSIATEKLMYKGVPLERWINFVHYGM
ncbi:hypothetical protein FRB95_005725 [Tulasnella sp. JGI-2019a]|nr:hypothetical protein FRB95_005725 [Tulasnella sp. JGI-2019a]